MTAKLEEKERQQLYEREAGVNLLAHLRRQGMSQQGRTEVGAKKGGEESCGGWARDSEKKTWAGTSPLPLMEALLNF